MKVKVTITGYYTVPDDPIERSHTYGGSATDDEVMRVDVENFHDDPVIAFEALSNDYPIEVTVAKV